MPAAETKAREYRSRSSWSMPSSVRTSLPAAFPAGIAQVTLGLPSTTARQHPHCPCGSQPFLVEVMPHWLRSAWRRDSPGRGSIVLSLPFRRSRTLMGSRLLLLAFAPHHASRTDSGDFGILDRHLAAHHDMNHTFRV